MTSGFVMSKTTVKTVDRGAMARAWQQVASASARREAEREERRAAAEGRPSGLLDRMWDQR